MNSQFINLYVIFYFLNTAYLPYIVHGNLNLRSNKELFIWDIHYILLASAFSSPIMKLMDFQFY